MALKVAPMNGVLGALKQCALCKLTVWSSAVTQCPMTQSTMTQYAQLVVASAVTQLHVHVVTHFAYCTCSDAMCTGTTSKQHSEVEQRFTICMR